MKKVITIVLLSYLTGTIAFSQKQAEDRKIRIFVRPTEFISPQLKPNIGVEYPVNTYSVKQSVGIITANEYNILSKEAFDIRNELKIPNKKGFYGAIEGVYKFFPAQSWYYSDRFNISLAGSASGTITIENTSVFILNAKFGQGFPLNITSNSSWIQADVFGGLGIRAIVENGEDFIPIWPSVVLGIDFSLAVH